MNSYTLYQLSPQKTIAEAVVETLRRYGATIDPQEVEYSVAETPSQKLGDYGAPVIRFLKRVEADPEKLLEEIRENLQAKPHIAEATTTRGYLNIRLHALELAKNVFTALRHEGDNFGIVKTSKPLRIVVEHTSANPVHPLHMGTARNMCLGDTLARLLRARGHQVQTRFYINDMGRQVAVLAYGVIRANLTPPPNVKPDHWIGLVYAITHTLIDLEKAKRELEKLRKEGRDEEYREKLREVDKLVAVLAELREKDPQLFDKLVEAVKGDPDPDKTIEKIMLDYEYKRDPELAARIRSIVETCLKGFRETMKRMGVHIDVWDWESDLAWSGMVAKILEQAKKTPYYTIHKGVAALDLSKLQENPEIRKRLGIPEGLEIPPLILQRSSGTTLYTTRDIAYAIKKFRDYNADLVVNVIGADQKLEQLQVRLALLALGYEKEAYNMIHYAYEMVSLPGESMSGRRGRYITLDEVLDQAIARARREVEARAQPGIDPAQVAEKVGVAAVRYTLVSVSAQKPITFKLEEALDFERNSAPYIMYTYARAHNILARTGPPDWDNIDYTAADENPLRRKLLLQVALYPYTFAKAADEMKPEILVAYINKLADTFNRWYPTDHVAGEPDPAKKNYKIALVKAVETVLANTLRILGIEPLERM